MSRPKSPGLNGIFSHLFILVTLLHLICPINALICPLNNGQEAIFNGVRYRLSCSRYTPLFTVAPYRDTPAILGDIDGCARSCSQDPQCVSATAVWEMIFFVRCRHYRENISPKWWILATSATWIKVAPTPVVDPTKPYIPAADIAAASAKCAAASPTAPTPLFNEKGDWQCCRPIQTTDPTTGEPDDVC